MPRLSIINLKPHSASMKAPPNRKGTWVLPGGGDSHVAASLKSLPKRKGNQVDQAYQGRRCHASMKAPPHRKGIGVNETALQSAISTPQ